MRAAVALAIVMHGLVAVVVIDRAVVQQQAVMVRQGELSALDHRQRGEVAGVHMHHAGGLRVGQVYSSVDVEGYAAHLALAAQHAAGQVADVEVAGAQFLEQEASRIDEEGGLITLQH